MPEAILRWIVFRLLSVLRAHSDRESVTVSPEAGSPAVIQCVFLRFAACSVGVAHLQLLLQYTPREGLIRSRVCSFVGGGPMSAMK